MDALLLAAGRGERLRPITNSLPKPLLEAGGHSLIEHRIKALVAAGITNIVVNHAHLGELIRERLEDGKTLGAQIRYSDESGGALETGGGILHAMPLLRSDPFLVVNADIWTDYSFSQLLTHEVDLAHLILVDNPDHHAAGDFCLQDNQVTNCNAANAERLTFSGIGLYRRALFSGNHPTRFSLAPLLRSACEEKRVSGEHYRGRWIDVGTLQRLNELRAWLAAET